MTSSNPFRRRENPRHWLVAVLVGLALATALLLVLSKAGYSNRPDVERAMEPPPRDESTGEATGAPARDVGAAPARDPGAAVTR